MAMASNIDGGAGSRIFFALLTTFDIFSESFASVVPIRVLLSFSAPPLSPSPYLSHSPATLCDAGVYVSACVRARICG